MKSIVSAPQGIKIDVDQLSFDKLNPRFADAEALEGQDDASIIKFYWNEVDLEELVDSMLASGYLDFDPMLVLSHGSKYVVLEGNRRLAALKLLRDPALARKLKLGPFAVPLSVAKTLEKISVRIMANRADSRAYVGFKHINGPHKWDSMAKAQYAAQWLRDGETLETITKTLGDRNRLVNRLVFGYLVLEQAEKNGFERKDTYTRRFAFSHLYTALTRPGFREYLGLDPNDLSFNPKRSPIPKSKVSALLNFMEWLFGSRQMDIAPIIQSQNPDLNRLNEVLQRTDSRRAFLAGRPLEVAYEYIVPASTRFADPLFSALSNSQRALSLVIYYDGDKSLLRACEDLNKTAQSLLQTMKARKNGSKSKAKI